MTDERDQQHVIISDAAKLLIMRRVSLVVDVLLIGGCVYLLASDIMQARGATPEFALRGGPFLVNLTAAFALVYRCMALSQRFWPAPSARKRVGVVKWSLVLALPLLVTSYIERLVHTGHRAQLDALVAEISAHTASAVTAHEQVSAADLATLQGPYLQELTVRTDTGAFLLQARVPALDIDGFAARYSSSEGVWHVDPYGSPAQTSPAFDAIGPLLVCAIADGRLGCEFNAK